MRRCYFSEAVVLLWLYTFLLLSSLSFVGISENERKSLYLMFICQQDSRDQNAGLLRFGLDGIVPEKTRTDRLY